MYGASWRGHFVERQGRRSAGGPLQVAVKPLIFLNDSQVTRLIEAIVPDQLYLRVVMSLDLCAANR